MIREELLALADELEAFEGDTCERCAAYEQPECRFYLPCTEIVAKYCARLIREAVEHDACEEATVSAYDLLPEEDLKALAWVREHGGLGAVEKLMLEAELRREPDTWERLEADAEGGAKDYCAERGLAVDGCAYGKAKAADLVRRARKLAEKESR